MKRLDNVTSPRTRRFSTWTRCGLVAAILASAGCGDDGHYGLSDGAIDGSFEDNVRPTLPSFVTLELHSVMVAPVKPDGCQWDGPTCSAISQGEFDQYAAAVTALFSAATGTPVMEEANQLLSMLGQSAYASLSKPDPFGRWVLTASAGRVEESVAPVQDTYTSSLRLDTVEGVPLDGTARLVVELWDEDFSNHDVIGTAELRQSDLIDALNFERAYWVPTARSANDGIVAVKISVIER